MKNSLEVTGIAPRLQLYVTDDGRVLVYLTNQDKVNNIILSEEQAIEIYDFFKGWMERDN